MCICCFACMYVYASGICLELTRPEEGVGSLELELPTVVGYHVDAGNGTLIFWESNRHS